MDSFKKNGESWPDFEHRFLDLLAGRQVEEKLDKKIFSVPTILLCSEATPRYCHRRLVAEYLQSKWGGLEIIHL